MGGRLERIRDGARAAVDRVLDPRPESAKQRMEGYPPDGDQRAGAMYARLEELRHEIGFDGSYSDGLLIDDQGREWVLKIRRQGQTPEGGNYWYFLERRDLDVAKGWLLEVNPGINVAESVLFFGRRDVGYTDYTSSDKLRMVDELERAEAVMRSFPGLALAEPVIDIPHA